MQVTITVNIPTDGRTIEQIRAKVIEMIQGSADWPDSGLTIHVADSYLEYEDKMRRLLTSSEEVKAT